MYLTMTMCLYTYFDKSFVFKDTHRQLKEEYILWQIINIYFYSLFMLKTLVSNVHSHLQCIDVVTNIHVQERVHCSMKKYR